MEGFKEIDPNIFKIGIKENPIKKLFDTIPDSVLNTFNKIDYNIIIAMDYYTYNYKKRTLDYNRYKYNKSNYRNWIIIKNFTWSFFTKEIKGKKYYTQFKNFGSIMDSYRYKDFFEWSFKNYKRWPLPIPVTHVFSKNNIDKFYEKNYYKVENDQVEKYLEKLDSHDEKYINNKLNFKKYVDELREYKKNKQLPVDLVIFKDRIELLLNKKWYKEKNDEYLAFLLLTQMPDINWTSIKFFDEIQNKICLDKLWYGKVNPIYLIIEEELKTFE